eukprot:gene42338-3937_t
MIIVLDDTLIVFVRHRIRTGIVGATVVWILFRSEFDLANGRRSCGEMRESFVAALREIHHLLPRKRWYKISGTGTGAAAFPLWAIM